MDHDELKAKLEPIVLNESLTMEQRGKLFIPIFHALHVEYDSPEEVCTLWNDVMADIVTTHNLGRH